MQLVDFRKEVKESGSIAFFTNLVEFLKNQTYNDSNIESLSGVFKYDPQNATPVNQEDEKNFINKTIFKDYCSFFDISFKGLSPEEKASKLKNVNTNFLRSISSSTGLSFSSCNLYNHTNSVSEDIQLVLNVSGSNLFKVADAVYKSLKANKIDCTLKMPFVKNISLGATDNICIGVSLFQVANAVTALQNLPHDIIDLINQPSPKYATVGRYIGYDFYNREMGKMQSDALLESVRDGIHDAVSEIVETHPGELIEHQGEQIGKFRKQTVNELYADLKILSRTISVDPVLISVANKHILRMVRKLNNCDYAYANSSLEERFNKIDSNNQLDLYTFSESQLEELPQINETRETVNVVAEETKEARQEIIVASPKIEYLSSKEDVLDEVKETEPQVKPFNDDQIIAIRDYKGASLVYALQFAGLPSDYEYRKKLAIHFGLLDKNVEDRVLPNRKILNALKEYSLSLSKVEPQVQPVAETVVSDLVQESAEESQNLGQENNSQFEIPDIGKYAGESLIYALQLVDAPFNFEYRKKLAEALSVEYKTAEDNIKLLNALKDYSSNLRKPKEKLQENNEILGQTSADNAEIEELKEITVDSISEQELKGNLDVTQALPVVDDVTLKSEEATIITEKPVKTENDSIDKDLLNMAFGKENGSVGSNAESELLIAQNGPFAPVTEEELSSLKEVFAALSPSTGETVQEIIAENPVIETKKETVAEPPIVGLVQETSEEVKTLNQEDSQQFIIPNIGDYQGESLIYALQLAGAPSSFEYRKELAAALGVDFNEAEDNIKLLNALKDYSSNLGKNATEVKEPFVESAIVEPKQVSVEDISLKPLGEVVSEASSGNSVAQELASINNQSDNLIVSSQQENHPSIDEKPQVRANATTDFVEVLQDSSEEDKEDTIVEDVNFNPLGEIVPEVWDDNSSTQKLVGAEDQSVNIIPDDRSEISQKLSLDEQVELQEILSGSLDKRFVKPNSMDQMQGVVSVENITSEQKAIMNNTFGELSEVEQGIEKILSGLGSAIPQDEENIDASLSDNESLTREEISSLVNNQIDASIPQEQLQKYVGYVSNTDVLNTPVKGADFTLFAYFENNNLIDTIDPNEHYTLFTEETITGREVVEYVIKYVLDYGNVPLIKVLEQYGISIVEKSKNKKRGLFGLFKKN